MVDLSIERIARDVAYIRSEFVEKVPGRFGAKQMSRAAVGALFFGLTFIFKGLLFDVSLQLTRAHIFAIVIATSIILSAEIVFIGYRRVPKKERPYRHLTQFWFKRFISFYAIAIIVATGLVYIYGIDAIAGSSYNVFRIVVAVSFPCAVGAAVGDLTKQY